MGRSYGPGQSPPHLGSPRQSHSTTRGVGLFTTPSPTCGISGLLVVVDSHAVLQAHQGRGRFGDRHRPLHRPTHVARERTSKASTGRACLPHCVAHTAAHIAPHEWAKVHTGTRNRGCVTAACGCRDIEMSAACTCPCRRSSTAGCMAGQPPLLKDSRVRGMCARGRTSNWLSVPEHTRLKRAAGRVRSGAGHGRDSRLESVATPPPNPSLGGLCIDTCGCGYRPRARGSRAGGPNHCTPCRLCAPLAGQSPRGV